MFAVEVSHRPMQVPGEGNPAVVPAQHFLVRRPALRLGAAEPAHVIVDDLAQSQIELLIVRGVGRKFSVKALAGGAEKLAGTYDKHLSFTAGSATIDITAIDVDLMGVEAGEVGTTDGDPAAGSFKALRAALEHRSPVFPVVVVDGNPSQLVSFQAQGSVVLGRSRGVNVRLESQIVSGVHARISHLVGDDGVTRFEVTDLGSTNGTFVGGRQVTSSQLVTEGTPILLGRDVVVVPVGSAEALAAVMKGGSVRARTEMVLTAPSEFPYLMASSDDVRPRKRALTLGQRLTIGRDPHADILVGNPHVSRAHGTIEYRRDGTIAYTDSSTNGSVVDGTPIMSGTVVVNPKRITLYEGLEIVVVTSSTEAKAAKSVDRSKVESQDGILSNRQPGDAEYSSREPASASILQDNSAAVTPPVRQTLTPQLLWEFFSGLPAGTKLIFAASVVVGLGLMCLLGAAGYAVLVGQ